MERRQLAMRAPERSQSEASYLSGNTGRRLEDSQRSPEAHAAKLLQPACGRAESDAGESRQENGWPGQGARKDTQSQGRTHRLAASPTAVARSTNQAGMTDHHQRINGKRRRPLGIPTIRDRALQGMVKNALEPSWEAQFEGASYGFRPGRSAQDAIGRVYQLSLPTRRKKWVVDADIEGAFDNIDHEHLLTAIGPAPGRELIRRWLQAGYVDRGVFHPTDAGTPQGGVISPLLANIALHGMEDAMSVAHNKRGETGSNRAVVRYADLCRVPHKSAYAAHCVMPHG